MSLELYIQFKDDAIIICDSKTNIQDLLRTSRNTDALAVTRRTVANGTGTPQLDVSGGGELAHTSDFFHLV